MKELLRMRHLQLRNGLSMREIERKSSAIMEKVVSLPSFRESKAILCYVNFGNEAITTGIIEKALQQGKTVCVPATSFKEKTIQISRINSLSDLEQKKSGLIEPKEIVAFPLGEIDLIIVPGVAFDREGYRIGYGGGFYDKLLRKSQRKTIAIGLCFEQNLELRLPRQSHDAKMNMIITEKQAIECG